MAMHDRDDAYEASCWLRLRGRQAGHYVVPRWGNLVDMNGLATWPSVVKQSADRWAQQDRRSAVAVGEPDGEDLDEIRVPLAHEFIANATPTWTTGLTGDFQHRRAVTPREP
jgi:hypothetical protein